MKTKKGSKAVEFISVYDARETFSKLLVAAKDTPHVVMNFAKPVAVIFGVSGASDLNGLVLETVPALSRKVGTTRTITKVEFVKVSEAREQLSKIIKAAQDAPHVVMNFSEPAAVIVGVKGREIADLVREFEPKAQTKGKR